MRNFKKLIEGKNGFYFFSAGKKSLKRDFGAMAQPKKNTASP